MAEIVLGMWTTHGPTLNTTPDQWGERVKADLVNEHWFKGERFTFDQLVERRADEEIASWIADDERQRRYDACQTGIRALADRWEEVAPDACVILGNDQRELFLENIQPTFTVYRGETFYNQPTSAEQKAKLPPGVADAEWAYRPERHTVYPGLPELAEIVFERAMEEGFDLAASNEWLRHENHRHVGTPHAFSFVLRRIMRDRAVPTLPVIANTFYPPNQPTARRCFDFGAMIGRAIRDWDSPARVAVVGSGGMSHFCIDEDLDRRFLESFCDRDEAGLCAIEQDLLQSGSSELRNWIVAAGVLFGTRLDGDVIDYVPCYRSLAGTGTANAFVCWT